MVQRPTTAFPRRIADTPTAEQKKGGSREPPCPLILAFEEAYLSSTVPAASSICFLIFSASSLLTPSLTGFGAPSTSAFASPRPRPVIARTSLMTLIFLPPSPVRITSNSVFSSAAGTAGPAAAGPATATAAAAETPHFSSRALARSAASRTVSSESWSTSALMSAICNSLCGAIAPISCVDERGRGLCGFLGRICREDPCQLSARLVDRAGDLARGRLDEAHDGRAQLIERGKLGKRPDSVYVEDRVAHRAADDLELVVRLGEIDGHLGRRDGVSGSRKRGRALQQVTDRLIASLLERNQGKSVLRNFELSACIAHPQAQVRGLRHRQTEVAGDHNDARVGEDLLQLGDQIGFLRTIHANSIFGRSKLRSRFNKSSGGSLRR